MPDYDNASAYTDTPLPDAAAGPSPFTAQSVYPADTGATNPALAKEFLERHRAEMAGRAPAIDNSLSQMQLNVDSMTKMLDDTVASIKASKSGRSNLPLMAMGAAMLSGHGNFGQQLGAGFAAMVPAIQKQRESDEASDMSLAQLGMKKALLQQAPLEAKLAYNRALQVGDQSAVRAIEQALIRAQATSGDKGEKAGAAQQKLMQKTVQDALSEARKQVDSMAKEAYATPEEREADMLRRFEQNIKIAKAGGVNVPDEVLNPVRESFGIKPGGTTSMQTRSSYFDAPTNPNAVKATVEAGLPPAPTGYIYESIGPKDRPKQLMEETKNFQKESKDWDKESAANATRLNVIDQIEKVLGTERGAAAVGRTNVGPMTGAIPNNWVPNTTKEAQTLDTLFKDLHLQGVPKGQGAVSEMERGLIERSFPNMNIGVGANKTILGIMKEAVKRDMDHRAFLDTYFQNYRTMDGAHQAWDRYISSPSGTILGRDGAGNPIPNANRLGWREYFRKERGGAGPDEPVKRAKGGAIRLGADYD